uniref:Uncharacterized protein n=1 Tax=Ciona savignyi TaxID=51511 RepID=H2Y9H6_CIOSA
MVENNITASKMKQLRTNIENLNVNTSTKNTPSMQPKPPSHPRVADGVQLKRHTRKSVKIKSPTMLHSKNDVTEVEKPIIKKLSTDIRRSLSNEATTFPEATNEACHSRLRCFRNVTSKSKNSNEATEISYSRKERKERDSPKTIQGETEGSGRFSPRTRRLLNALESETYQRKSYVFPRARQMSGMTFNRHDMYLRSYGLLPTPDQAPTIPDSPSPRTSDELDSKVYETNQGVQYSSIDGYPVPPYWYAGRGFLKS